MRRRRKRSSMRLLPCQERKRWWRRQRFGIVLVVVVAQAGLSLLHRHSTTGSSCNVSCCSSALAVSWPCAWWISTRPQEGAKESLERLLLLPFFRSRLNRFVRVDAFVQILHGSVLWPGYTGWVHVPRRICSTRILCIRCMSILRHTKMHFHHAARMRKGQNRSRGASIPETPSPPRLALAGSCSLEALS
jgi:hypothetical protein